MDRKVQDATASPERKVRRTQEEDQVIDMAFRAIRAVTGKEPCDYIGNSRAMGAVKLRNIFAYICRRDEVRAATVADVLLRSPISVPFMVNSAKEFLKMSEEFRQLFDRIDEAYKSL